MTTPNSLDSTDHSNLRQKELHHNIKVAQKSLASTSHNISTHPTNVSSNPIKAKVDGETHRRNDREEASVIKQNTTYQQVNIKVISLFTIDITKLIHTNFLILQSTANWHREQVPYKQPKRY